MRALKYIFIAICFFSLSPAIGYEVPKDAVIKVYDASGKEIGSMSRSEYKVVKIENSKVEPEIVDSSKHVCIKDVKHYHSVILHLGKGNDGLAKSGNGSSYTIREKESTVGGVTACVTENGTGICASAHTNQLFQIGVKMDFN